MRVLIALLLVACAGCAAAPGGRPDDTSLVPMPARQLSYEIAIAGKCGVCSDNQDGCERQSGWWLPGLTGGGA